MDYRRLGDSGLKVSEIGLGCNNFGMRIDQEATNAVIDAAIEHGVTFLDTADVYGYGDNEILVGKAIRPKTLAKGCDLERIIGPAHAGTGDRIDADDFGAFLHRAGFQARDLGLGPPRFAFGGEKSAAATCQRDKDEAADQIPANTPRHPRRFNDFI